MNPIVRKLFQHRARPDAKGAAAVEFALVLILLVMIVAGIIEFGRLFWYYDALTKATRDGARLMSIADKNSISSAAVPAARSLVIDAATKANVSPVLTSANVQAQCLDANFAVVGCSDGTAPANVRVGIVDFTVVIGGWMPILLPAGGVATITRLLSPHTTMRYML